MVSMVSLSVSVLSVSPLGCPFECTGRVTRVPRPGFATGRLLSSSAELLAQALEAVLLQCYSVACARTPAHMHSPSPDSSANSVPPWPLQRPASAHAPAHEASGPRGREGDTLWPPPKLPPSVSPPSSPGDLEPRSGRATPTTSPSVGPRPDPPRDPNPNPNPRLTPGTSSPAPAPDTGPGGSSAACDAAAPGDSLAGPTWRSVGDVPPNVLRELERVFVSFFMHDTRHLGEPALRDAYHAQFLPHVSPHVTALGGAPAATAGAHDAAPEHCCPGAARATRRLRAALEDGVCRPQSLQHIIHNLRLWVRGCAVHSATPATLSLAALSRSLFDLAFMATEVFRRFCVPSILVPVVVVAVTVAVAVPVVSASVGGGVLGV